MASQDQRVYPRHSPSQGIELSATTLRYGRRFLVNAIYSATGQKKAIRY